MSFHISISFVRNDVYYIVYSFVTYTNHFIFLFSVNNDSENENEEEEQEEEDESYKGEAESNYGKSIGSFVCEGQEIVDNVGGIHHVHIVMNHNPQEEMMGTNFNGLTSHLAFFMTLPLVLSVSFFILICINKFV
jgi:hypothetical protein